MLPPTDSNGDIIPDEQIFRYATFMVTLFRPIHPVIRPIHTFTIIYTALIYVLVWRSIHLEYPLALVSMWRVQRRLMVRSYYK